MSECPYKKIKLNHDSNVDPKDKMSNSEIIDREILENGDGEDEGESSLEDETTQNGFDHNEDSDNDGNNSEYAILDEYEDSGSEQPSSDSEMDLNDDDIEKMLNEDVDLTYSNPDTSSAQPHVITKEVLEKLQTNHFEMLPEGWIEITHNSGMPVYLHRQSRIMSMTRPYFLGPGSARKHKIPVSAIPCLEYRKQLDEKKKTEENHKQIEEDDIETAIITSAKVVSVDENARKNSLEKEEVVKYCKKLFLFKTIQERKFRSWVMKRAFVHKQKCKNKKAQERPTLPTGTKLITVPVYDNNKKIMTTREWSMNPNGKSYVCILHEYLQRALKKKPIYEYRELENAKTPYAATIKLSGMEYGTGIASSKKQAKMEAAKATLEILIPEMKNIEPKKESASVNQDDKYSLFDVVKITDPRVTEFCAKSTEPSPYSMLLTCLERNFGIIDQCNITSDARPAKHNKILFKMQVGDYKASVICKNKRDGKQKASQKILQDMHPHIAYWGSLLRLYGNTSMKGVREKKNQEQEITQLQSKATVNSPNFAILDKLKLEMSKIYTSRQSLLAQSKGTFIPPSSIELPTSTSCDSSLDTSISPTNETSPKETSEPVPQKSS